MPCGSCCHTIEINDWTQNPAAKLLAIWLGITHLGLFKERRSPPCNEYWLIISIPVKMVVWERDNSDNIWQYHIFRHTPLLGLHVFLSQTLNLWICLCLAAESRHPWVQHQASSRPTGPLVDKGSSIAESTQISGKFRTLKVRHCTIQGYILWGYSLT